MHRLPLRLIILLCALASTAFSTIHNQAEQPSHKSPPPPPKPNPDPRDADRHGIESILTSQQDAWNRGDISAFLTGYWHSPDLTFSGSSGISRGFDGVAARYKRSYPDRAAMGHLDFSQLEFRFLGPDAALVLGHWQLQREKDAPGGVFSLILQRFPEGWRIIHDHTSAANPQN